MTDKTLAQGSCNCGGVTFSVNVLVTDVYVCHCSICRKSTGSGGIAVTVVPTQSVSFHTGTDLIKQWQKPNHDWLTNFCSVCGSPLPGKNDDQRTFIPVSLFDSGYEHLEVKHHIFTDSKASWEVIADNGKQHKGAFGES